MTGSHSSVRPSAVTTVVWCRRQLNAFTTQLAHMFKVNNMAVAQEAQASGVLMVGDKNVGKFSLIAALQPDVSAKCHFDGYELVLDTKYYTAQVAVQVASPGAFLDSAAIGAFDAVVLVFDASRQESFDAIKRWYGRFDTSQAEIRLVVANKADLLLPAGQNTPSRPSWLEGAMDWACQELFEYVEVAATVPAVDTQLVLDGDRQGVERVAAALSAHMWPGLQQKPRVWQAPLAAEVAETADSSSHADRDQDGTAARAEVSTNSSDKGHAAAAGTTAAANAVSQQEQQQQRQQQHRDINSRGDADLCSVAQQRGGDASASDRALEAEVASFERMLLELQGARERFANLPNKQRRTAAAELAMRFASMLSADSDEDGDLTTEDEESDDLASAAGRAPVRSAS